MEFLDGPPLSGVMANTPMTVEAILDFSIQLCDALGAAHERGIVHRDLKPDNIHLVRQGNRENYVKVLDFGIAKVGGAADKKLTQAGQVFGTPHYMSPEQCSGREVDHRTDIYAVGIILYEAATGKVPFDADNLMGVLTKHVYEQPIPPRELPPPVDVPPGLEAVILHSLAKQPQDRYQSMAELKSDLVKVQQGSTPDAVMQSVGGVPRTQMIASGDMPALAVTPAMSGMAGLAEPEQKSSKVPLVLGALAGLVLLGGAAFAGAFFFLGQDDTTGGPVIDGTIGDDPTTNTDVVTNDTVVDDGAGADTDTAGTDTAGTDTAGTDTAGTDTAGTDTAGTAGADTAPATPVLVRVTTEPDGAEIYTGDGTLIGNAPMDIPRPTGSDTMALTIRSPGYEERSFPVSRLTGAAVTVRLERERRATGRSSRRQAPVAAPPPTVRPLAGPPPTTGGGGGSRRSIDSEIINPW
jgi:serine/threonine-protein kinase